MSLDPVIQMIQSVTITIFASSVLLVTKQIYDKTRSKEEEKEIQNEVNKAMGTFSNDDTDDILRLMRRNVGELKEYYTINKQQARNAFSSALIICFLGFILFALGFISVYFIEDNGNIVIYTTISGSIVEIISGLFFWLYSQSLKQINLFHESLRNTEKFLTAIQLAEKLSVKNQDLIYGFIIQSIFKNDNLNISKNESETTT
ncbi:TRADD-N-associated membrane domain-containing protein [Paenibacillus brasilensis]|uniref:Cyanobacterial TRADD-N associated 2 transmembrane domain-containing protein n=1 Tax=Paenibacillus brasilensis TaxID=128574 RepID=A0ABU0L670_9BACL|nr:hypothetical protein [Paenibacillus brasilensis]MDQ0496798.1 hypothetical protein [Paenibacillus brasilensis]